MMQSAEEDQRCLDNNPEECSVCFNNYDDNQLRPRTLPCGHTFCSQCIDNANKNGQLTCPSCRAEHAATAATRFPINYGMEALIRKLKGIKVVPEKTLPAKPIKAPARGINELHKSVQDLQHQKKLKEIEEEITRLRAIYDSQNNNPKRRTIMYTGTSSRKSRALGISIIVNS
nr:tripartite motif-containing protein 65-like [Procambarus clarkii]